MHLAFDTYLPAQRLSVEAKCAVRDCQKLAAFSALRVSEKAEAVCPDSLYKNHAHTGYSVC